MDRAPASTITWWVMLVSQDNWCLGRPRSLASTDGKPVRGRCILTPLHVEAEAVIGLQRERHTEVGKLR